MHISQRADWYVVVTISISFQDLTERWLPRQNLVHLIWLSGFGGRWRWERGSMLVEKVSFSWNFSNRKCFTFLQNGSSPLRSGAPTRVIPVIASLEPIIEGGINLHLIFEISLWPTLLLTNHSNKQSFIGANLKWENCETHTEHHPNGTLDKQDRFVFALKSRKIVQACRVDHQNMKLRFAVKRKREKKNEREKKVRKNNTANVIERQLQWLNRV